MRTVTLSQLIADTARKATQPKRDTSTHVPRQPRPEVHIRVDRHTPDLPAPGTVTTTDSRAEVYVGRLRYGAIPNFEAVADQVRPFRFLVIIGTTQIAATDLRRRFNQRWKLADLAEYDGLSDSVRQTIREQL